MKRSRLLISGIVLLALIITIPLIFFFYQRQQPADTVMIDPGNSIGTVPNEFPGLGMEPSSVCTLMSLDQQGPRLSNIFKNLGPSILRFGGDAVETTGWSSRGTAECSYSFTMISGASIDGVFSFARRTGLRVIWPVDLRDKDPAVYSDEAAYAVTSGGRTLAALEIGNEPDLYGWDYSQYRTQWEAYVKAIKSKAPNAPISGPALCCEDSWFTNFLNDDSSKIMLATQHIYPLTSGTISDIMAPDLMNTTMERIDTYVQAAKAKNLSLQIDETDPFVDVTTPAGHQFASSLWVADYMLSAAEHGAEGVNVFGQLPIDQESPLNSDGSPRATYYGALFFHNAAPGHSTILKPQFHSSLNVVTHATLGTDGKLRVAFINKDQKNATIRINTTRTYSNASAIRLNAPSITAISGITLGGASVASDGTWSPQTTESVRVNGALSSIEVPAYSAVIVTYQNGESGNASTSLGEIQNLYCNDANSCPIPMPAATTTTLEVSWKRTRS